MEYPTIEQLHNKIVSGQTTVKAVVDEYYARAKASDLNAYREVYAEADVAAQVAIADYLQHGGYDRHLRKLRQQLQSQQNAMHAAIAHYFPEQTRVTKPDGGYFLWLEFPKNVDSLQIFTQALMQGISIAPGPIFSAARRFQHCVRLNYGHPWTQESEKAMETLGKITTSFI